MASESVLASSGECVRLWRVGGSAEENGSNPIKTIAVSCSSINALKWNHNNNVLVCAGSSGYIGLTHSSGAVLGTLPNQQSQEDILSVCFSSGSRYLCTGGTDKMVKVWDLKTKDHIKTFKGHTDAVTCLSFSHNDSHVVSGSDSGDTVMYSVVTGQSVATFKHHNSVVDSIKALEFSLFRKNLLATAADSGSVTLWDVTARSVHATFPSQHAAPCTGVVFSPANQLLFASSGLDKKIFFYDAMQCRHVKYLSTDSPLTCLSFMDDGVTIAAGTSSGRILAYDLRAGNTPTSIFTAHTPQAVNCLQFQRSKDSVGKGAKAKTPATTSQQQQPTVINPDPKTKISETPVQSRSTPHPPAPSSHAGQPGPTGPAPLPAGISDVFSPVKDVKPITPMTASRQQAVTSSVSSVQSHSSIFSPLITPSNPKSSIAAAPSAGSTAADILKSDSFSATKSAVPDRPTRAWEDAIVTKKDEKVTTTPAATVNTAPVSTTAKRASGDTSRMAPSPPKSYAGANVSITSSTGTKSAAKPSGRGSSPVRASSPARATSPARSASVAKTAEPRPASVPASPLHNIIHDKTDATQPSQTVVVTEASPSVQAQPQTQMSTEFQAKFLQSVLEDSLQNFGQAIHTDVQNLHLELLRQFHMQQTEIGKMLNHHMDRYATLLDECDRLRKENEMLRNMY